MLYEPLEEDQVVQSKASDVTWDCELNLESNKKW